MSDDCPTRSRLSTFSGPHGHGCYCDKVPKIEPTPMPDNCQKCPLAQSRTQIVVSRGSESAPVLFVGEAPGAQEDRAGEPFVGRSGTLLDKWISYMGLDGMVCITNVCRCRPPKNRTPTPEERRECGAHLLFFIQRRSPKVVVAVGRTAEAFLREAGVQHLFVYHPSYYLRQGGTGWEDEVDRLEHEILTALSSEKNIRETLH